MNNNLLDKLSPLIGEINRHLEETFKAQEGLLSEIGLYNYLGGGKRLRPLVFLLAAHSLKDTFPLPDFFFRSSIVFELIHMASLLHDDIVDHSEMRRGRKSAHLVFGITETVLSGDFILARASTLAMETGSMDFIGILTQLLEDLSIGELKQLKLRFNSAISLDDYYDIIKSKTAVLMSSAARAGALIAKGTNKELAALTQYGLDFGLGFQIKDDILDYKADPKTLGKPTFKDLAEGRITLPIILAAKNLSAKSAKELLRLAAKKQRDPEDFLAIASLIEEGQGIEEAQVIAEKHAENASLALGSLPDTVAKGLLIDLARYGAIREN
ncbi:MAG: polyprenyl synthetase family protein [Deltaproteobacteria bacterium]|jgi:octaprenyl-diphosphate synthase|nr:polyprenyl synthetase family protein [Deltaproteobacteria bacterium]